MTLTFCLVLLGYVIGAIGAFELLDLSDAGAVFFAPAGVTAAAILLSPVRRWPVIVLAALLAEIVVDAQLGDFGAASVFGFALANGIEPLVGGAIVRRCKGPLDLSRRADLGWFLGASVALGPFVGGLIGGATVALRGGAMFGTAMSWWLGDALGVLVIGGALLAVATARDARPIRPVEGVAAVSLVAIFGLTLHWISDLPVGFLAVIPVVTLSARYGTRFAAVSSLIVAGLAILAWFAEHTSSVAGLTATTGMTVVQLQLLAISAAALLVAAESTEREMLSQAAGYQTETVRQLRAALAPDSVMRSAHVDAEGISRAASERLEVGGDWYDILELDGGEVSIVIGDVVGHGEEAVVAMGRMRSAAAALAMRTRETGLVLDWLDEFARGVTDRPFATAFFARFDPEARTLTYSTAGHPPALLGRQDGTWEWLFGGRSTPIGVPFPSSRPSATVALDGPCTLIVYTDGAVERAGEVIDTGLARVFDAVTRQPTATVDELLHSVTAETVRDDASFVRVQLRC
jgi:serine phosphatase RsbU (regulator of sigma subunit)